MKYRYSIQKQIRNLSVEKNNLMNIPDEAREQAVKRAQESVASGEPMAWFEELYNSANGDNSKIPWADGIPNPYLTSWFEKTGAEGNGRSAVVVGCGLGEDAEELSGRGFNVQEALSRINRPLPRS
jgi:hypothetical protein